MSFESLPTKQLLQAASDDAVARQHSLEGLGVEPATFRRNHELVSIIE